MSCVLEILSEHELKIRKKYLINQIKKINEELSNRNILFDDNDNDNIDYLEKIGKNIVECENSIIQDSANCYAQSDVQHEITNNNVSENKIKKIKIKINIKKKI
jgi:hypothetical protein